MPIQQEQYATGQAAPTQRPVQGLPLQQWPPSNAGGALVPTGQTPNLRKFLITDLNLWKSTRHMKAQGVFPALQAYVLQNTCGQI